MQSQLEKDTREREPLTPINKKLMQTLVPKFWPRYVWLAFLWQISLTHVPRSPSIQCACSPMDFPAQGCSAHFVLYTPGVTPRPRSSRHRSPSAPTDLRGPPPGPHRHAFTRAHICVDQGVLCRRVIWVVPTGWWCTRYTLAQFWSSSLEDVVAAAA